MPTLYMAWRGVDDDQHLYWAVTFDGQWWSRQLVLSDQASLNAPALTAFQDELFMAWRGANDDNLWWSTYDGNAALKWSDQHHLADRGSAAGPALAVFQDNLYMAWRGVSGDDNLYWAIYDANDPPGWKDQHLLSDRATADAPTLAVFQDKFFMAWRGVVGDENLYWATFDPNDPRGWSDQHPLTDRGSTEGPALATFQNKLYMVWKGVQGIDEDDQRLFWATYDENAPGNWTGQTVMERTTPDQAGIVVMGSTHRASLAVFQNDIFVAGAGPNIVSSAGLPDTGEAVNAMGEDPSHPPPLEPKGIFYFNFDGEIPSLPIRLFPNRASEAPVAQAVYFNIPLSLKNVMLKHGLAPSKGVKEFVQDFSPATSSIRPLPLRPLTGF